MPEDRLSTAVVVVKLMKMGQSTNTNTIYDILKVTTGDCHNSMFVKVFHNDGNYWADEGKPAVGSVVVLKSMKVSFK